MESSKVADQHESSEEDEDSNREGSNSPPASRWGARRVPLPRQPEEKPFIDLKAESFGSIPLLRPPFEVLKIEDHEAAKDDDDEEDDEEEDNSSKQRADLPMADRVTAYQPSSETVTGKQETIEGEVKAGAGEDEPMLVADNEQQAVSAPEFDEVMQQLGPEFAEATPGDTLEEPNQPEAPTPEAQENTNEYIAPQETTEEADAFAAPPSASSGSGRVPPPPPPPVGPPAGFANFGPSFSPNSPNWNVAPANTAPVSVGAVLAAESANTGAIRNAEHYAEKRGMRRGLVAGFITGYVVKAYLANRKLERFQQAAKKELNTRDEQISSLQYEQHRLREQAKAQAQTEAYRPNQHFEHAATNQPSPERFEQPVAKLNPEALPPIQEASLQVPEEKAYDQEGQEIVLQPGQRLERRGWYSVVLDEHGREVQGAIRYGEAFKREQKREQLGDSAFGAVGTSLSDGTAYTDDLTSIPPIARDQIDPLHELEFGPTPQVDVQHRLPKPRNQVVTAVTSPWLWTAVAILLIAYFIAALA